MDETGPSSRVTPLHGSPLRRVFSPFHVICRPLSNLCYAHWFQASFGALALGLRRIPVDFFLDGYLCATLSGLCPWLFSVLYRLSPDRVCILFTFMFFFHLALTLGGWLLWHLPLFLFAPRLMGLFVAHSIRSSLATRLFVHSLYSLSGFVHLLVRHRPVPRFSGC